MAEKIRIGTISADGVPVDPEANLAGDALHGAPTQRKMLPGGKFVVLDGLPPAFDLDAALAALTPVPPAPKPAKNDKASEANP